MFSRSRSALFAAIVLAVALPSAHAQSTMAFGSTIVIPVVAQTGSYSTEVFVHSPVGGGTPTIPVDVTFVEATTSGTPGSNACTQLVLPSNSSVSFQLATQCSLGAGSHFGYLILHDASAESVNRMFAYSRTQNPQAIGFSVEGFPVGELSAQSQRVNGLKRVLPPAAIPFQTNCFIGSFGKPVDYVIRVRDSTGGTLGTPIADHLDAQQMRRYLDVFAAAGLPTGDFVNASVQINSTNASTPGNRDHPLFVSFCTVQDNVSFGADFRIGKSFTAFDATRVPQTAACSMADCGAYDFALSDVAQKHVFPMLVRPPDNLKCELLSDRLSDLELQLRDPDSLGDCDLCSAVEGTTAVPVTAGSVVAGGDNETSFYYSTGIDLIRPSDGAATRTFWKVEVSARESVPAPAVPITYSLKCSSGSGIVYAAPMLAADDF